MPPLFSFRLSSAFVGSLAFHALILFGVVIGLPETETLSRGNLNVVLNTAPKIEGATEKAKTPALPKEEEKVPSPQVKKKNIPQNPTYSPVSNNKKENLHPPKNILVSSGENNEKPVAISQPATGSEAGAYNESSPNTGKPSSRERGAVSNQEQGNEGGQTGIDPDEIKQYRWVLGKAVKRFKRYPKLAREREQEGDVEFLLAFKASKVSPEILLTQTSGHEILDKEALEMIRQALKAAFLPDSLKGHSFNIPLKVRFNLEDES